MNPGMRYYVQSEWARGMLPPPLASFRVLAPAGCKDSSCALVERGFQGEYFDLYTTPIQSHYAEVVW